MVVDMKAKFLIVVLAALVLATGTVWARRDTIIVVPNTKNLLRSRLRKR